MTAVDWVAVGMVAGWLVCVAGLIAWFLGVSVGELRRRDREAR